ncbi:hypothetical protein [Brachybacterium tyrofermentans]|uniref:hypothetical protein n=1 Tax=Brachybacterium tyrofermentans TaxID=47848 RepID=UPI003F8F7E08
MSNIQNAIVINNATRDLGNLNRIRGTINLDPLPGPDLDNLPDVTAPTPEEITRAVLAAKGSPGADKQVQALHTCSWLASTGALDALIADAWGQALTAAKATIPAVLDDVRAQYKEHGKVLMDAAQGRWKGVEKIAQVATDPAARALVDAEQQATVLHIAWRHLSVALGHGAGPARWSEFGTASIDHIWYAMNSRPQKFPNTDVWSVACAGFTLDLPENLNAAQARRNDLIAAANKKDDDIRTLKMKGENRAAERLASISSDQHEVPDAMLS